MGFPVGYSECFLPRLVIFSLSLLGFLRSFIASLFQMAGFNGFLESDIPWTDEQMGSSLAIDSVSSLLIRQMLPVVLFEELRDFQEDMPDSCAVCLNGFEGKQEIRRLCNCRHIFHRGCLERWMDHDQNTCPLCRTTVIPSEMLENLNQSFWLAAVVPDYYGEHSADLRFIEPWRQ